MNHNDHCQHHDLNSKDISSRFKVEGILGKGAFATVFKAIPLQYTRSPAARGRPARGGGVRHDDGSGCRQSRGWTAQDGKFDHYTPAAHNGRSSQFNNDKLVSLKIVNVSQIIKRKRDRKNFVEATVNGKHDWVDEKQKHFQDDNGLTDYDTEALFFPSRIVKKQRNIPLHYQNGDEEEYKATTKLLQREISVHLNASKYNHPNIVSMFDSFNYNIVNKGRKMNDFIVAMVVEYCPYGDLQKYLKHKRNSRHNVSSYSNSGAKVSTLIEEREIRHAMRHILRGLSFLHSHGIVHRDIKAGNVLLTNNICDGKRSFTSCREGDDENSNTSSFSLFDCCLKIGDFGLAVQMSDDDDWDEGQNTICGTPSSLAPEVALSNAHTAEKVDHSRLKSNVGVDTVVDRVKGHGQPADLWSAGCLLYVMIVGKYPFSRSLQNEGQGGANDKMRKMKDTIERIVSGNWQLPDNICCCKAATELLSQLLTMDPNNRGFARGILSSHLFFNEKNSQCSRLSSSSSNPLYPSSHKCSHDVQSQYSSNIKTDYSANFSNRAMSLLVPSIQCAIPSKNVDQNLSSTSSFIKPLHHIHLLSAIKYEWKISTRRCTFEMSNYIDFTVYILPRLQGVVVHCEHIHTKKGIWMHVTGNGDRICFGKLSKSRFMLPCTGEDELSLISAAFSRQPKKYNNLDNSLVLAGISNSENHSENQSFCTTGQLFNTTLSTPSSHSMPLISHGKYRKKKYKKLSHLLQRKNRTYLSLYKKLQRFVTELRVNAPVISVFIHKGEAAQQPGVLLCTANIHTSYILVTFADKYRVKYDKLSGTSETKVGGEHLKINLQKSSSIHEAFKEFKQQGNGFLCDNKMKSYISYLQFTRSVVKKCVEIEKEVYSRILASCSNKNFSLVTRTVLVRGKSFRNWVDVTNKWKLRDNEQDTRETMATSSLNSSLQFDTNEASLSLLEPNNILNIS